MIFEILENGDLQEALLKPSECGQEKLSPMQPTIQRKVSFRDTTTQGIMIYQVFFLKEI